MASSLEHIDIQITRGDSEPIPVRPVLGLKTLKSIPQNHTFIVFNSLNRPVDDTELPPGWTFHSLLRANPLSTPQSGHFLSPTSSTDTINRLPGYFYYAERRITTNLDVANDEAILSTLLADPRTKNTDEFTEMVAIPYDGLGGEEEQEKGYTLYRADHFNRMFYRSGLESNVPFGTTENPIWMDDYSKWIHLIGRGSDSHLFLPSTQPKKYSCLGRKIAQQVVWDHQNGISLPPIPIDASLYLAQRAHFKDRRSERIFDVRMCFFTIGTSEKACYRQAVPEDYQNRNRSLSEMQVFCRFGALMPFHLNSLVAKQFKQPPLHPTFSAGHAEGADGPIVLFAVAVTFFIWAGPMLGIPSAYFRRMRTVAARADKGSYLPHLWSTFIKGLLKEWNDLNIVLALVLSANVGFLALPGLSENGASPMADLSRGAGIFSTFVTLGGLLSSLSLIWLHQPMLGTGSLDACKYILGPSFNGTHIDRGDLQYKRGSFLRLLWMATYLGMPLVLLVWSVIAFVICALTWTVMYSAEATKVSVVVLCGLVLTTPLVTLLVFWGPIVSKDTLFGKMARGDPSAHDDHDSQY